MSTKYLLIAITCAAFINLTTANAQNYSSNPNGEIRSKSNDCENWSVYDALPGHPTFEEKQRFSSAAIASGGRMERDFGVPAEAIAAMAILESGYGWTRTALFANNYFGWKQTQSGVENYTLICQPSWDVGNNYVIYQSLEDSMKQVSRRLRDSPYYKDDTTRFKREIEAGIDRKTAVRNWIEGIAEPYNHDPANYTLNLIRIINNPDSPSQNIHLENSFWNRVTLEENIQRSPTLFSIAPNIRNRELFSQAFEALGDSLEPGKRYLDNCIDGSGTITTTFPNYEGIEIKRCIYEQGGLKALVYTYMPSKIQFATWVTNACSQVKVEKRVACINFFSDRGANSAIYGSNGVQFPVLGNVIEDREGGNCSLGHNYYNIFFKDGITIQLIDNPMCIPGNISIENQEQLMRRGISKFYFVSRISAINDETFERMSGTRIPRLNVQHQRNHKFFPTEKWGELSRENLKTAISTGEDRFLTYRALHIFGRQN